ncbi:hypothetical protein QBC40DRAFT_283560 [Triangularia verruculosa]|uniref:Uncharacterized protein n=1 Tax=Triangularia verruculosa TaxID=2587418 RepID=A0AAN6XD59_9PEZI|nr:hypothetical protein QBC40DRAFT_283560 [Triangularia verruculosa]
MCKTCSRHRKFLSGCLDGRGPAPEPQSPPLGPRPVYVPPQRPSIASDPRRSRPPSRTSTTSSVDSTATVNSAHSLTSLARRISRELYPNEAQLASLETWAENIDVYIPRGRPWAPEVVAQYEEYKRLGEICKKDGKAFFSQWRRTEKNTTVEEHLERAELALRAAESAYKAGKARLDFLLTYQNAYSDKKSVDTHIKEIRTELKKARDRVHDVRINHENLFIAHGRKANPDVFR